MTDILLEAIKQFTEQQAGKDVTGITENSSLEKDLGIYGDDATEYLLAFGKTFDVDVSNFMAAEYFSAEGHDIFAAIARLFTGRKGPTRKEFTIKHLMKAVDAKKLDEDVINS